MSAADGSPPGSLGGIAGASAGGVRRRGRFALARLVRVPVAAWYLVTGSAGTRSRFLMSYPMSRAQARTATVPAAGLASAAGARPARCPADLAGVLDALP
jgi:hypothetical protein